MATASTVPAFIDALLAAIRTALPAVQVVEAWPGPDTADETVFIGEEITEWTLEIPTMKAGRKQRQESYVVTVECWVAKPGALRSVAAGQARTRAIQIIDAVDSLLANTPKLQADVQTAVIDSRGASLVPFGTGWACQSTAEIRVEARLT